MLSSRACTREASCAWCIGLLDVEAVLLGGGVFQHQCKRCGARSGRRSPGRRRPLPAAAAGVSAPAAAVRSQRRRHPSSNGCGARARSSARLARAPFSPERLLAVLDLFWQLLTRAARCRFASVGTELATRRLCNLRMRWGWTLCRARRSGYTVLDWLQLKP